MEMFNFTLRFSHPSLIGSGEIRIAVCGITWNTDSQDELKEPWEYLAGRHTHEVLMPTNRITR